ncbi:MAG: methyltransferase domain-containing protein [Rhodocyclaceae bacterium]|nr:methyltransferase domain-containing protein [Rhodocyclaceae bacterium]MDZ4213375.1 methyltransferase domain-containing protein [Rhodocyclaceae bacterium]
MKHSRLLLTLLIILLPALAGAQERSISPGVNRAYENPEYARWQVAFETEGREIFEQRHAIVDALAIKPGMVIADVGAGTGVLSLLFAQKVGAGGTAIAQDIVPEFLRGIEDRARKAGLSQVRTLLGGEKDARLLAGSVDLIFTSDTYHHFEYPQAMLASLRSALKPGGRLIVIDYEKIPGRSSSWVMSHVRANRETVIAEITAAGFHLDRTHDFLQDNYFLEFRKP